MPGVDGAVKVAVKATACPGSTGSTGNATRPKPQLELSLGFSEPKLYMLAVVQEVSPVFVMVIVAVKVAPGATEAGALILMTPALLSAMAEYASVVKNRAALFITQAMRLGKAVGENRFIVGLGVKRLTRLGSGLTTTNVLSITILRMNRKYLILAGNLWLMTLWLATGADASRELRVGIEGHAFDHLGAIGGQAEAAAASGANIIYVSGLGALGYQGLPSAEQMRKQREATVTYLRAAKRNGIRLAIG